jgi:hypothetical protein
VKKIQCFEDSCAYIRREEEKIIEYAEYAKVLEEKWDKGRSLIVKSPVMKSLGLVDIGSKSLDDGWSVVKKRTTKKELNPIVPCKPTLNRFSYLYDDN